jgi:hypothetical protein
MSMSVDISLHPMGNTVQGNLPPAPSVPIIEGQAGLAEATVSQELNVPRTGAILALVATAKLRVDIRPTVDEALLNAATSPLVLGANERVHFALWQGNYKLVTAVYV